MTTARRDAVIDSLQGIDDRLAETLRNHAPSLDIDGLDIGLRRELVADVACGDTSLAAAVEIAIETLEDR